MVKKITGSIEISEQNSEEIALIENISNLGEKIESLLDSPISELFEIMIGGSIELGASDIHIEPGDESIRLRIRMDGILQEVILFKQKIYSKILSRIKLLSGLKLNITDRPQDGRFSIFLKDVDIEMRVSILPSANGETLVLRILDPRKLIELGQMGIRKDLEEIILKEIKRPHGMIIVTGPTGSGKTTTLYAFLTKIRTPENKIITIENPIEYHLEGISQTQVSAERVFSDSKSKPRRAYDFASGLKSIMRQDPDVILVGEVRDGETVDTALQAALTGHLVLTTLHTNDAAGAIARLISLGGNIANIGPAVNMIIAQRLLRKVCKKCHKLEKVSSELLGKIKKELEPIESSLELPSLDENLQIAKAVGCKICNFTGYKGRIGIFEILLTDESIEKFILREPSIAALREMIIDRGMTTIRQDAFIKIVNQNTTEEELERIIGE